MSDFPEDEMAVVRKPRGRHGDQRKLCETIMKTTVSYAMPEDSATDTAQRMRREDVSFMPVCDRGGKVLGTVTERDIALRVAGKGHTKVRDIMSHEAVYCGAQDNIGRARALMELAQKFHAVCVDEEGRLEGLIELSDLVRPARPGGSKPRRAR